MDLVTGCVNSHFLDSGAFTLWTRAAEYAKKNKCGKWDFYDTDEFWQYLDKYADFIKRYHFGIDLYANVDTIPNPELSWRNLKYLEDKHGLTPVPVVHFGTDLKWLRRYMKSYDLIGLGGLVGRTAQDGCREWIDRCFDLVCDTPNRLPRVKIHGFGVTVYRLLLRYPWYSVDSTSWTKVGAYGRLLVPHKRKGRFVFNEQPYAMAVSIESPTKKIRGQNYLNLPPAEKRIVEEWLAEIGIPLGKWDKEGNNLEDGVVTWHSDRRRANLLFFEMMRKSLPEYPWPFRSKRRKGFL